VDGKNECVGYKEKYVTVEPRLWLTLHPVAMRTAFPTGTVRATNTSQVTTQVVCRCIEIPFVCGCMFGLLIDFLLRVYLVFVRASGSGWF